MYTEEDSVTIKRYVAFRLEPLPDVFFSVGIQESLCFVEYSLTRLWDACFACSM